MEDFLAQVIKKRGSITFKEFMKLALYHPEYGYYTARQSQLGKVGDFYTSVHVSPLFGAMMGRQIAEVFNILSCPPSFIVTEFGAGDGALAYDILTWLEKEHQDCFQTLTYQIVEISPELRKKQAEALKDYLPRIKWVDSETLEQAPFEGVILSNELIDALPVHLAKFSQGQWLEAWVSVDSQGKLTQQWEEASQDFSNYFKLLDWYPKEGQVVEVNFGALKWLDTVSKALKKGIVITIDYGYLAQELEQPHRFDGTLLCYHQHKVVKDPFVNLGEQDMTSHANFTALMKQGEKNRLKTCGFMTQAKFLLNLGIMDVVESMSKKDPQEARKQILAVKKLAFPEGMGEIFKVLIQHKGLEQPQLRCLVPFHKQMR